MNRKNAALKSVKLQEMVTIKKLNFQYTDERGKSHKPTRDVIQRSANFEEFKTVYASSCGERIVKKSKNKPCPLHTTKSGSLCRFPQVKSKPQYVETINVELPVHYGADRAVHQLPENKIKPKKSNPKMNREVITENIVEKLKKMEEVEETEQSVIDVKKKQVDEIHQQMQARKEMMWKNLPRVAVAKPRRKHQAKDKIMAELANINEKLEKMQKKYYDQPRVQYKSVNDCFTQSGHVEVIYANEKYPEEVKVDSDLVACDMQEASGNTIENFKMQKSVKEMNNIFPEFPTIEDTLREIETHLDNIVNLEAASENIKKDTSVDLQGKLEGDISNCWGGGNLAAILAALEKQYSPLDRTNEILRDIDRTRDAKLRSIRKQIEVVEEFCDRMSEIANDESDSESISTAVSNATQITEKGENRDYVNPCMESENKEEIPPKRTAEVVDFMEGPDLEASIKKSNYLSKEFGNFEEYSSKPVIKVFSENDQRILWRKKMRSLKYMENPNVTSSESVIRLIDNLKYTLENSVYELVG